ncbi:ShlB/FhaC/HecB family hemolysin secretion/activation protein [Caenimonas soli]|uniref:ShlB/FhaC/HecB family hemolysin secretion/activation protein n=1 Tax=Caenimonas soli TaxID=2735555 RepID=UPI0015558198|nr:ShlB/FhaC/HecB family hemolysin secretion/activation protein [Caenimonas soli]NPC57159.1 ShlB/FhaC/HecB family hemolysin secretion/activation protein [Caenimonas soli]
MITGFCAPRSRSGGRARLGVLALAAMAATAPALAQAPAPVPAPAPAPMAAAAPSPVFAIKGFKVTGDNPLGDGETTRVLAPFLRADATIETLQKATAALEAALRDKGYGLHRVALPPQEVGDTVSLTIVKFTVAKVNMDGRSIYDEGNIRRSLPELREGHSPNFKTLAIQTAIANENPNKQIQVGLREADEPDKIEATVTVKESRPWTFAVGLSNAGSESSGRDRLTVSGGHTNLFNRDHQFVGAYTTSIERTEDVKQLGLAYKVPLYSLGGVIGASYTRSDVVGNFGTFTSTGAGHTLGVNYTLYLAPQGGRRSYVTFGLEDKVFDATQISGIVVGVDRRSRPITLGYSARTESDAAVRAYNVDLAFNTGSGRNNDLASYQNEDPRISTVHWKALRGGLSYSAPFAQTWIWSARSQYQYSPDVLISGEQFGLGGVGSVRGTSIDRPITGDKGVSASFEITTPELATGLRLLGFLDAGWLGNNSPDGFNRPSSDRLASLGLGLRFAKEPFAVSLDYGRLVKGSRVPLALNSAAPQQGDDRFYVNLSMRF